MICRVIPAGKSRVSVPADSHLHSGIRLATSEDIPGLVAQGRTVMETLETARDVAKKIIEARAERAAGALDLKPASDRMNLISEGKTSTLPNMY